MLYFLLLVRLRLWTVICPSRHTDGQGLVEYALILGFVVLVVVISLGVVGQTLCTDYYLRIVGPDAGPLFAPDASCSP